MYRSYSYSNMPKPITDKKSEYIKHTETRNAQNKDDIINTHKSVPETNHMKLKNDDIILLIIAAILVINGCDDKLLIAALIYIFISGYMD